MSLRVWRAGEGSVLGLLLLPLHLLVGYGALQRPQEVALHVQDARQLPHPVCAVAGRVGLHQPARGAAGRAVQQQEAQRLALHARLQRHLVGLDRGLVDVGGVGEAAAAAPLAALQHLREDEDLLKEEDAALAELGRGRRGAGGGGRGGGKLRHQQRVLEQQLALRRQRAVEALQPADLVRGQGNIKSRSEKWIFKLT